MIRVTLGSVGLVEETGSVVVVLRAAAQSKLLLMEVGLLEGRAIAIGAEGVKPPRPLTHDLLLNAIERLGASVVEVRIRDYADNTFYAELVLQRPEAEQLSVDARPSDAIAVALRSDVPIYVAPHVLDAAGVSEDEAEGLPAEDDEAEESTQEDGDTVVH